MAIVKTLAVACLLEADMNSEDTAIGAAGVIALLLNAGHLGGKAMTAI
jgi:hypothetical protein